MVLSLLVVAVSFYLPHHIAVIGKRAWWYYAGDEAPGFSGLVRKATGLAEL